MLLLLFFTILVFNQINAQELLSLREAVAEALSANHDIQVAKNNAEIGRNNVNIGNADLLPRIDFISGANYYDNDVQMSSGINNQVFTNTSAKIQASYTLFDGFGNIYTFNKLKAAGQLAELQARYTIENVLLNVSSAYYSVARAEENLRITQELVSISLERLDRARKKSEYGQAKSIDVLSAEVDLNADSVSLLNSMEILNETKYNLNLMLNRDINLTFTVERNVNFTEMGSESELIEAALTSNSEYLLSKKDFEMSELDLKITSSADLPSLTLQTSYGYNQSLDNLSLGLYEPDKSFAAGVTLSYNLFNGFRNSIQKQNAEISVKNKELMNKKALLSLRKEITNSLLAYQNSLNILDIQKRNFSAAEQNFKRANELYSLGQLTTTTFREAQLNLISSKNNITNATYDSKLYEIDLMRITGQLVK